MGLLVKQPNGCDTPETGKSFLGRWWLVMLALVVVITLAIVWLLSSEGLADYKQMGYPGAFMISLLAGATIIIPIPGSPTIFALGGILTPWILGPVAGLGEALGEFTGYLAGRGGHDVIKGRLAQRYEKVESLVRRRGLLIIFMSACTLNPVFDLFGFAAGAVRLPSWKFFFACWGGKTVKNTALACLGMWGMGFLLRWLGVDI